MTCTCIHAHASHMNVKSRHAQLQVLHGANTHMHVRVFRCQCCFKLQQSSNHRATVAVVTAACGPVAGGGGVAKAPAGHSAKAGVDGVGAGSTGGCARAAGGEADDSAFTATAFAHGGGGRGEMPGLGDFATNITEQQLLFDWGWRLRLTVFFAEASAGSALAFCCWGKLLLLGQRHALTLKASA